MDSAGGGTRNLQRVTHDDPGSSTDETIRQLPFAGAFNFRDLGGYRGAGGREVRWKTLFRADALHRLADHELDVLEELGVRTVLDLRTTAEVDNGRLEAEHLGITHHHLPVLGETWAPLDLDPDADAGEVLGSLYIQMLDVGAPALGGAMHLLADDANLPAVFHCAAGKDRTGVLAALVLTVIGVDDAVIVEDYALSALAMEQLVERLRVDAPDALSAMNDQPSAYLAAPVEAMHTFLGHLRSRHGSAEGYLSSIGVGPDVVDGLRTTLLH